MPEFTFKTFAGVSWSWENLEPYDLKNEKTLLDYKQSKNKVTDKETLELRMESPIENNIFENKPSNGENTYFIREKFQTYL